MTQAMAVPVSEVQSLPVSLVQDIPLSRIQESKTNPRRQFDELKLAELSDNIRQHGVLQPVLVRPMPDGEPDTYELVAGARRFRASKLAKRETIPASIRELTDTECLELQLIENCNVPTCTNSMKLVAMPRSCGCSRKPIPSKPSPKKSGAPKSMCTPGFV